ncbi:MAG: hypothetical protein KJZ86_20780 [Caldilineaceae bacterium]|nr:hypothetical protein [Caldilineaceae bacterium]HRJ42881.1 hypothetical protein [Caldilineaceae bacterium]
MAIPSLEQEIRTLFQQKRVEYDDHSGSFTQLDFGFGDRVAKRYFAFDVKEKRQSYNLGNWQTAIPEAHFFILDDLACRKILLYAPNAGLLVRDTPGKRYLFFTVVDLFLMPKNRVNRSIRRAQLELKGKWLIDLRNGRALNRLDELFPAIDGYLDQRKAIFHEIHACYGDYVGEEIGAGGIERRPEHWDKDFGATR